MSEIVYFALSVAYDVGRFLRNSFYSAYSKHYKKDRTVVTNVDIEAEKMIVNRILSKYPSHRIVSEELGEKGRGEETWYIDPIDGTSNFTKKIPFFTTSIAFESKSLSFGVVYAPLIDEMYYTDGSNSYLNGEKLRLSPSPKELSSSYLGVCHAKDRNSLEDVVEVYRYFKLNAAEIRKFGSTSLEMCYVSSSRIDAFIGVNINTWDFKASYYIAKNAGARVEELIRGDKKFLICARESLYPIIKEKIEELF